MSTTSTAIHFFSLRRSGTHAVANYISKATGAHLYNNVSPELWKNLDSRVIHTPSSLFVYEDRNPQDILNDLVSNASYEKVIGKYDEHIVIVNMRDPVNLWASRIKHWHLMSSEGKCIDKARMFGLTGTYLQMYIDDVSFPFPTYKNIYNKFVNEKEGREELHTFLSTRFEDVLPFEECEPFKDYVDVNGCGSSFVGRKKRDNYHNGYLYYKDSPAFVDVVDEGITEVCKDLFDVEVDWDE